MSNRDRLIRAIRDRSSEHGKAMQLLADAKLAGQMVAVLRQELDSMVRSIYLIAQPLERRNLLIDALVNGEKWTREGSRAKVTDRELVDFARNLQGWAQNVYKFGCAFIHLSILHDYNNSDPLEHLTSNERSELFEYCRFYHSGPPAGFEQFTDLVPYFPKVLEKISANLDCYLEVLERNEVQKPEDIW
ncbi:hypothetical protein [Croceicoccus sp. Ery15]|uniref:hypothetical protein n=1 Tax=Croceicoccus sp. Ery15 TaxID=1703338 RepID=UPI001E627B60|nr:hypothetical protein [Croceicoccus sp. Ery15]